MSKEKTPDQHLDYFFLSSPDPMTIAKLDGELVAANPAWKNILDLTPEEVRGRSVFDFVHPDDLDRLRMNRELLASGARSEVRFELRGRHRDGSYAWFETHSVRQGDLIYAVQRDISARKQHEIAADASLRLTRAILDAAADSIVVIDRELIISDVSPGTERVYGLTPAQCLGQSVLGVVHSKDRPAITATLDLLFSGQSEEVRIARFRAMHADGRWLMIESRGRLLSDDDGGLTRAVLVSRDVTEADAAEAALEAAKAEAEQANLAKSEFLSRMSHELRTPLNSVLGFAQLLQMEPNTKSGQESVDYIYNSGRHLLDLINEVLDISRVESGTMTIALESVALDELVNECVGLISLEAHELGIAMVVGDFSNLYVRADVQRLKQVLLNLLSNAIKFNRSGGTVCVECVVNDDTVRLNVIDTGAGISPEHRSRLFAPFDRLDAELRGIEGTGLGLALSKGLMEVIGGSIGVESTPGTGSTFWIEMPVASGVNASASDDESSYETSNEATNVTLLYIEDNISNLRLIERLVQHRPNVRLIGTLQGRMGLELAVQHRPDLILLDVHLPDIPGYDVLQRLRADPLTASIPVVMLSADATPSQIQRFRDGGAANYVVKPLDLQQLLAMLDEYLGDELNTDAPTSQS